MGGDLSQAQDPRGPPEPRVYPSLLRGLAIERPHPVGAAEIPYVPMAGGFMYLVALLVKRHQKLTPGDR
jgi:hypothetical protein